MGLEAVVEARVSGQEMDPFDTYHHGKDLDGYMEEDRVGMEYTQQQQELVP